MEPDVTNPSRERAGKWRVVNSVLLALVLAFQAVIMYQLYARHIEERNALEAFKQEASLRQEETREDQEELPRQAAQPQARQRGMFAHPHMHLTPSVLGPDNMDEYMNNMFERASAEFGQMQKLMDSAPDWDSLMMSPTMDMREQDGSYILTFSLPGVDTSEVDINLDGRLLTISSHFEETNSPNRRGFSHFNRKILLPGPVADPKSAKATYTNGMLRVVIPRAPDEFEKEVDAAQEILPD